MGLQPHEQRVFDEYEALMSRIVRLDGFFRTDACKALEELDRELLHEQHEYMTAYANILSERIARFRRG